MNGSWIHPRVPRFPADSSSPRANPARDSATRTRTRTRAVVALGALALLAACRPSPSTTALPPDAVAQIGTRILTTAEFSDELRRKGVSARNDDEARQRRHEVLDALVEEETLVQCAQAAGLDREPEVQRRIRRLLAQEFRERSLGHGDAPAPAEDDLKRWYDSHAAEFTEPPQARGQLILLRIPRKATDEIRSAARSRIAQALASVEASTTPEQTFADLARTVSDDPGTRRQGGDTGWVAAGRLTRWPDQVTTALFALQAPGTTSQVIETPDAVFLVRLTDRQPSRVRPFEEVRPRIEHRVAATLKERREREFLANAKSSVPFRDNPAVLASIPVPAPTATLSQTPPALPGSVTTRATEP